MAGITLAYLVLCTSVQALPALFPVWLVTLLGNGYAVQVVRWFMVGVVAVALVRQWETVLRVPLAFLLAAVFLSALAAVLFSLSETSAAVSSLLVFVQKPVIVLGYLCMVGTVITLPRRTNTTRDHSLIFIHSLQFVVAGLLLICCSV